MSHTLRRHPVQAAKPGLVVMPSKVLVTDTLIGSFSTDEVLVLRQVAELAAAATGCDDLYRAIKRARQIQRTDRVLAKAHQSLLHQPVTHPAFVPVIS